ncbi:siderophore-interacting protein [Streptomyces sp. ST2-7A]|uniref:siderophore-interacting protein n=1 Tax=Streptomyces sp. ST2-7A TaxID=2907214 RepID=UPI001F44831A|nr:siderophore-interacting protein [Streptomyces sp. ST2-7A]MCE7080822.1 siderophore-interacting protein [Streptomyces sp. ST2-7A]
MAEDPFDFFDTRVVRTREPGPGFVRVTLAGSRLADFACGGRDQRLKLFIPAPGRDEPLVPRTTDVSWYLRWRDMDPSERAVMRSYTVREQRRDAGELDIDFALHHSPGPAARWARDARPGDPAVLLGPLLEDNAGVDFRPPSDTDRVLLTGDETALPAIAGILAWLPAGMPTVVLLDLHRAADLQPLPTRADADIRRLAADRPTPDPAHPGVRVESGAATLTEALRGLTPPPGRPYAWIAGEAAAVREQRRHLVNERGVDRSRITFTGYWRRGASEDDLLAAAMAGGTSETD